MITYPTDRLQKVLLSGRCVQNGTPTPDTPIDIVCNNGVLKYGAIGKNLFDDATKTDGIILNDAGNESLGVKGSVSDYIKVKPNTTYTLSLIRTQNYIYTRVCTYSADKTFIDLKVKDTDVNTGNRTYTFTTDSNVEYIRFCFKTDSTNVQLEQGSTATSYEPYQADIYTDGTQEVVTDNLGNTATAEMLLGVGNYKDTQEVLSGKVTRNIGIKVLDGTEDWVLSSNGLRFYLTLDDCNKDGANITSVCNYLAYYAINLGKLTTGYTVYLTSNIAYMHVAVANFSFTTLNEYKAFLADQYANGTPVIVVYPLAEPTTEQVTPQPLAGSSATVTAGSIDNLPIESSTIAELKKRYIGDKEVKRVYIGDNLVWKNN